MVCSLCAERSCGATPPHCIERVQYIYENSRDSALQTQSLRARVSGKAVRLSSGLNLNETL